MEYRNAWRPAFMAGAAILALVAMSPKVLAEHVIELEVTDVTAERATALTVPPADEARREMRKTAGGVDLVEDSEYRDGRVSTLQDSLGYSPGVLAQPRFGAEEARLSIRGSGLQRTFHLRGIELLQDGVPLNQADGGGDFQAVEPLAARYIEVFRGANALRHGGATLGGSINFVSPSGYDADPLLGRLELGSFSYRRGQAALAGVDYPFDYHLSFSHFGQHGFREHARQGTQRLFTNAGWRLDDAIETRFYLSYVDTESELPGSLTRAELKDDPSRASPGNVTGNQRRDFKLVRLANRTAWRLNAAEQFEFSVFYLDKSLFHPIFQVLEVESDDYGFDTRFVSDALLGGRPNRLTAGLRALRGGNRDDRFVNLGGEPAARTNQSDQAATHWQLFVEDQYGFADQWTAIIGVHALRAGRESRDRFIAAGQNDESFDETYSGASPKVGLRFEPQAGTQIFANLSRSFEPPSFAELRGGPGVTIVDAQSATTFEFGARIDRAGYAFEAAYYRARVDDELLSLADAAGNPLGTVNADRTRHQGIELGLDWHLPYRLNLRSAYAWNDFRFDDDAVFDDNRLAGVPPHLLRSELLYRAPEGWYAGPTLEWSPRDYYIDHANTFEADSYSVWGLKLGRRAEHSGWFVEGRNLGDRVYAATTGVVADANGVDSRQFLPGDGRSFFAGLEWRGDYR